jgi:hypothetical protein
MNNFSHLIITGAPRSGSTALTKLLGQQKEIFVMNEMGIYDDWDNAEKWHKFIYSKEWINFIENEEIFKAHNLDLYEFRKQVISQKMSGKDIFKWILQNTNARLIGDKCPITYLENMDLFITKFPNAKFIIIIRDGRDVVASQIRGYYRWPPGNLQHAGHWMKQTIAEAQYLWAAVSKLIITRKEQVSKERLYIFKYEEAIKDTNSFCNDISNFIDYGVENINEYFKAVNVGKWQLEHPNMMNELSNEFKELLRYFDYVNDI